MGKIEEAMGQYKQALQFKPDYAEARDNLGNALRAVGRVMEAVEQYQQVLRINPDLPEAHYNLGIALDQMGKNNDAIEQYEQALRINPDFFEAHCNLGGILIRLGRIPEAVEHYNEAVRILPGSATAHHDLAIALVQQGKIKEAIGHYERALRLKPDFPGAQNGLAWLLATIGPAEGGDPVRAVTLAQRACELTSNNDATCLDTLAAAYAAAGRFNDAIAAAKKAIELAGSAGQSQLVGEIEARLQLYRNGQPYHDSNPCSEPVRRGRKPQPP